MATDVLKTKLRSASAAIVFLEQQHQTVLKDLHAEIDQLRRRCQELQFSLATQTSAQLSEAEAKHRRQAADLQRHLRQQTDAASAAQRRCSVQAEKITALQQQVKWTQVQLENECEARVQATRQLRADIAERDAAIQHLSEQVHQAALRARRLSRSAAVRPSQSVASQTPCRGGDGAPVSRPDTRCSAAADGRRHPLSPAAADGRRQPLSPAAADGRLSPMALAAGLRRVTEADAAAEPPPARPGAGRRRSVLPPESDSPSAVTAAPVRPGAGRRRCSSTVSLPPIQLNQSVGSGPAGRQLLRQQLRVVPGALTLKRPSLPLTPSLPGDSSS